MSSRPTPTLRDAWGGPTRCFICPPAETGRPACSGSWMGEGAPPRPPQSLPWLVIAQKVVSPARLAPQCLDPKLSGLSWSMNYLQESSKTLHRPPVLSASDHFDSQSISLFLKPGLTSGSLTRAPSRAGDSAAAPPPPAEGGLRKRPERPAETRPRPPPRAPTGRESGDAVRGRDVGGCGASAPGGNRGRDGRTPAPPPKPLRSWSRFAHPTWGGGGRGSNPESQLQADFSVSFCVS